MKIRNGFVSNSSSSSFVIAYKRENYCECCKRSDPTILDLVRGAIDCHSRIISEGVEGAKAYVGSRIGSDKNLVLKALDEIDKYDKESNWNTAVIEVESSSDVMSEFYNMMGNGLVKMLFDEETW